MPAKTATNRSNSPGLEWFRGAERGFSRLLLGHFCGRLQIAGIDQHRLCLRCDPALPFISLTNSISIMSLVGTPCWSEEHEESAEFTPVFLKRGYSAADAQLRQPELGCQTCGLDFNPGAICEHATSTCHKICDICAADLPDTDRVSIVRRQQFRGLCFIFRQCILGSLKEA